MSTCNAFTVFKNEKYDVLLYAFSVYKLFIEIHIYFTYFYKVLHGTIV